ncbi:hypothetical protein E4T44_01468 [Aureobasidium sp. EXF-8845]|nr:hypothetical protein E4T44_01468 [Aureobasidium sp. EXF-8845]KAI4857116.1 hypothetical protein E4T45_01406 [Aureobasidium sp. EXF-8846]
MVATRAMAAKKAPNSTDDKENDNQLSLRKKPVRRATAKSTTTATKSSAPTTTTKASTAAISAKPVSTTTSKPSTLAPAARPKRQTRAAATAPPPDPAPTKAPATRRKPALPEVARGKALRSRNAAPEPEHEPEPETEQKEPEEVKQVASPQPTRARTTKSRKSENLPEPELEQEQGSEAESELVAEPETNPQVSDDEEIVEEEPKIEQAKTPRLQESEHKPEFEQDVQEKEDEEESDGCSEDEICGPKTPMRRTTRSQAAPQTDASSKTARNLQTPARRFLSHRKNQGTPQTQRMPYNATRTSSPPRPMTVARGVEKSMVYRPLKHRTPQHTPMLLATDHQSDVNMTDEELQENSETDLEESSADELDDQLKSLQEEDVIIMPTPAHAVHLEALSDDSEDELAGTGRTHEEDDDDELDEDTVVEVDDKKEPEYLPAQPDVEDYNSDDHESTVDESVLDESILPEPKFSADFTTSVPSSPASVAADPPQMELEDSELLSSPAPSTPGSIIERDLDSPTQEIAPASGLSIDDNDLLSLIEDDATTPNTKPRVSFSTTTAKMLQTPRMRFALGGVDATEVDDSPSVTTDKPEEAEDDQTATINPSLLEVDDFGVKLAYNLENAAAIPTPYFATPAARERFSMGIPKERMSLLQDDIFNLVDFDHVSPAKAGVQTPNARVTSIDVEPMELSTPGYSTRRRSLHSESVSTPNAQAQSGRRSSLAPLDSPGYAWSTFAFDSRRKSLPSAVLHTPVNGDVRPHTAETSIKPTTSDSFAKLWASKQRKSPVRKSLLQHTISDLAEIHSSAVQEPRSSRKRDSMPSQRRASTAQSQLKPVSPYVPFSGARPRRHTPSSSFKTSRSPFKTRSSSRSPMKNRSPMKLRDASRSPVKRLREAPRTPMKTPLKAAGLATPAVHPMTPHPLQPLKSVTALVEVFTLDGSSASGPFTALLQGLGARTTKSWSDRVTHVIFKDGSPTTLQRVRLSNKDPNGKNIFCVNSRWVTDCERNGTRMDEQADIYSVDLNEVPRGGRRRRKSMEPAALRNVDGNIVHSNTSSANSSANRKSVSSRQSIVGGRKSINLALANKSLARVSLASSFWGDDSPVKKTPGRKQARDRWDDDEEMADAFFDEPTAKFEVPTSLGVRGVGFEAGQMTAPVDRVRKLRIRDEDNRRLTFMGGRE